jgi:acyl dehydratase
MATRCWFNAAEVGEFPFPAEGSLVGLLDQFSQFHHPVFIGDTLHPMLEIGEMRANQRTGASGLVATAHNQTGQLVMTGKQRYLVRRRPD